MIARDNEAVAPQFFDQALGEAEEQPQLTLHMSGPLAFIAWTVAVTILAIAPAIVWAVWRALL